MPLPRDDTTPPVTKIYLVVMSTPMSEKQNFVLNWLIFITLLQANFYK